MTNAVVLESIERTTLNELAYDRLKRALLSGRIERGVTLTLRQLARELGTSMMPVRDAVTRLSAEQALTVIPNRGICIPPLSEEEAEDLWRLRINLEGEASAQAARGASKADHALITRLCGQVRRAAEAGDLHALLERNSDFQFSIYQAAGSPISLRIIETLRMKALPHCTAALRYMLTEKPTYFENTFGYHDGLVAAIIDGDARAARRFKQIDLKELRDLVKETGIER
jgi:DNA-binding GntR family transcriptional regulator